MNPISISPVNRLSGEIILPGDKSISHRAVMCGAIARGNTHVQGLLDCDDCNFTMRAFKDMGVRIERDGERTTIYGSGIKGLKKPAAPINVGNSGTSMRILAGILAGQNFETTLTGDEGLMKRPMKRIVEPLVKMGVDITCSPRDLPPIRINGGAVKPIDYKTPIPSAQVKSAILFAGLYADARTTVVESVKSRDHTERMLKYFGANVEVNGLAVSVRSGGDIAGREIEIPGDVSSASFFAAGAILLGGSAVKINKVSINPTRAGIFNILSRMGAKCRITNKIDAFEPYGDIEVESGKISGVVISGDEIPGIIDELPIIFVLASLATGRTIIEGAEELRVKETDRIVSMKRNLEKMGGRVSVERDRIVIDGVQKLKGAPLKSYGDHRTCMSMAVAAMAAEGDSTIDEVACVSKSFPGFFNLLETVKC